MRYGIMYSQGDIVLIPIPFTYLSATKKRPVLIMSNSIYNTKTEDVLVVAITSNLIEKDFAIMISNGDMLDGELKVDSCIRVDKIYTLSKNIIIKKFASVKSEIIQKTIDMINNFIEINDENPQG